MLVPLGMEVEPQSKAPPPRGWHITDREATFDGVPVSIAPSRLKLLSILASATEPVAAKDLIGTAFDRLTSETNARFHIAELRKELKKAFPSLDGDPIETDGGYRLAVGS
ncbi:MAG TPA: hypothetical protein VG122_24935 [Gemmata sp.]|nr:hypothetical protein [Gemmata sp.]